MKFKVVSKEDIITKTNCLSVRVLAVTGEKDYKHCKMLGVDSVKLQRKVSKGKFETFATAPDLYKAVTLMESYINTFTCGQKCARIGG